MSKVNDLTGRKINMLTILKREGSDSRGRALWMCKCDCGNTKIILGSSLMSGNTSSCGCNKEAALSKRNTKHGFIKDGIKSRVYNIWVAMRDRCNNPNNSHFSYYGGRGISVCAEWNQFEAFQSWALTNGYADDLSIDRINVDGNYEPSNCRWENKINQARNKSTTHFIEHNGVKKSIAEWSEITGIDSATIRYRINAGWKTEQIFSKI